MLWTTKVSEMESSPLSYHYSCMYMYNCVLIVCMYSPAARNHVNRLCLAAGVVLIESGSAGYLGQVTVIRKVYTLSYVRYIHCHT